jgi:hypothetical protein
VREGGACGAGLELPVAVEEGVFCVLGGQLVRPPGGLVAGGPLGGIVLASGPVAGREVGGGHVRRA